MSIKIGYYVGVDKEGEKVDIRKIVGGYCRQFREETLKTSITDFSKTVNENAKNISAFEHGRANNIKYLFFYSNFNNKYKEEFLTGLFNLMS